MKTRGCEKAVGLACLACILGLDACGAWVANPGARDEAAAGVLLGPPPTETPATQCYEAPVCIQDHPLNHRGWLFYPGRRVLLGWLVEGAALAYLVSRYPSRRWTTPIRRRPQTNAAGARDLSTTTYHPPAKSHKL